jgi:enamine deaminase RidA (YjgF/YER057c/UK114 family)
VAGVRRIECSVSRSVPGPIWSPSSVSPAPCASARAGTAPILAQGGTAAKGDVYGQTIRCLEIIEKAIADAGGQLTDVIRTRIMLTDMAGWEQAARAHGEYFGAIRPVTTVVQVVGFVDPDWLVELEADAIVA